MRVSSITTLANTALHATHVILAIGVDEPTILIIYLIKHVSFLMVSLISSALVKLNSVFVETDRRQQPSLRIVIWYVFVEKENRS